MTTEELKAISKLLLRLYLQWAKVIHGFNLVTDDKIYCIHIAENKDDIRKHAKCGNFPVNTIEEIKYVIDPSTAA